MKKILWGVLCFISLQAIAADLFVMTNIPVAAEGKNALEARERAMNEGQKKAFEALLDKIAFSERRSAIKINPEEIPSFVQDISVKNERMGGNRYFGDLTVRFKAPLVRTFLQKQYIPFLSRLPQPMLVIPVFNTEGQTLIFDENNPLYAALRDHMPESNLFELITLGDSQDKNTFNEILPLVPAAENLSYESLKPLLNRYHLTQALIINISKDGMAYELSTQVLPAGSAPEAEIVLNVTDDREDLVKVMRDLNTDALKSMTKKWRYLAQDTADALTLFHVFTPVEKVSDLTRIQQKIKQMRFADRVDIKGFSHKRLAVDFYFRGSPADFAQKLRLSGMRLLYAVTDDPVEKLVYLLVEENSELVAQAAQGVLVEDGKSYQEVDVPVIAQVGGLSSQEKEGSVESETELSNNQAPLPFPASTGSNVQNGLTDVAKSGNSLEHPKNNLLPVGTSMLGIVPVNSNQVPSITGTSVVQPSQTVPAKQIPAAGISREEPGIFNKIQKSIWGFFSGTASQKPMRPVSSFRSGGTGQSIDIAPQVMKNPVPVAGQTLDESAPAVSSNTIPSSGNILPADKINNLSAEGTSLQPQSATPLPAAGIDLTAPVIQPVSPTRGTAETQNTGIPVQPAHVDLLGAASDVQPVPMQLVNPVNGQKFSDVSTPAIGVISGANREGNSEPSSTHSGTASEPLFPPLSSGQPPIVQ